MLFVGAKVSQFLHLPQGQPEREGRVLAMVAAMDRAGFGRCSNHYECEAVCPKRIAREVIRELNREFLAASLR
jgi:succinate dehydrogenase / fumarate reductase iron-sulfur subunit